MTPGSQFPPVNLATLHAEIDLPVEKTWWTRWIRAIAAPQHRATCASHRAATRLDHRQVSAIAGALNDLPGLLATALGFLIFFLVYGVFA